MTLTKVDSKSRDLELTKVSMKISEPHGRVPTSGPGEGSPECLKTIVVHDP